MQPAPRGMTVRDLQRFLSSVPPDNQVYVEDEDGNVFVPLPSVGGGPDGAVIISPLYPTPDEEN